MQPGVDGEGGENSLSTDSANANEPPLKQVATNTQTQMSATTKTVCELGWRQPAKSLTQKFICGPSA